MRGEAEVASKTRTPRTLGSPLAYICTLSRDRGGAEAFVLKATYSQVREGVREGVLGQGQAGAGKNKRMLLRHQVET